MMARERKPGAVVVKDPGLPIGLGMTALAIVAQLPVVDISVATGAPGLSIPELGTGLVAALTAQRDVSPEQREVGPVMGKMIPIQSDDVRIATLVFSVAAPAIHRSVSAQTAVKAVSLLDVRRDVVMAGQAHR